MNTIVGVQNNVVLAALKFRVCTRLNFFKFDHDHKIYSLSVSSYRFKLEDVLTLVKVKPL